MRNRAKIQTDKHFKNLISNKFESSSEYLGIINNTYVQCRVYRGADRARIMRAQN